MSYATDLAKECCDFVYNGATLTSINTNSSKVCCESVNTCCEAPKSNRSRFDDVLDIYKKKKMNEIGEKTNTAIDMLVEEDVDVKILKETIERIKNRNKDKDRCIPDLCYNLYVNDETNDKIKIVNKERDTMVKELKEKIQEVKVLLELTDTFQEAQGILKEYGII